MFWVAPGCRMVRWKCVIRWYKFLSLSTNPTQTSLRTKLIAISFPQCSPSKLHFLLNSTDEAVLISEVCTGSVQCHVPDIFFPWLAHHQESNENRSLHLKHYYINLRLKHVIGSANSVSTPRWLVYFSCMVTIILSGHVSNLEASEAHHLSFQSFAQFSVWDTGSLTWLWRIIH